LALLSKEKTEDMVDKEREEGRKEQKEQKGKLA
jgi:hypothetical protein